MTRGHHKHSRTTSIAVNLEFLEGGVAQLSIRTCRHLLQMGLVSATAAHAAMQLQRVSVSGTQSAMQVKSHLRAQCRVTGDNCCWRCRGEDSTELHPGCRIASYGYGVAAYNDHMLV